VIIEGVDKYRVTDPLFECVRVVLSHRGEPYSPAYVQGISGAAFRIAGICPCAPTCSFAMETQELVTLLGYDVELVNCEGGGWQRGEANIAGQLAKMADNGALPDADDIADPEMKALRERLQQLIERTKAEVREGRPVIFWHGFTTAEFDVVCGYDNEQKKLLGRGSYAGKEDEYASAPETRAIGTALVGGGPHAILIGQKTRDFDARTAEIAALRQAVAHARSTEGQDRLGGDEWIMLQGLLCYDRWVREFSSDPERKRTMGDSYCLGIYRSTHRAAAGFMRELSPKYPEASQHFDKAVAQFTAEADTLDQCNEHLGWQTPEGPDPERNARVAPLLTQARDGYAAGIDAIEEALEVIG
jgi:hypothetical protein